MSGGGRGVPSHRPFRLVLGAGGMVGIAYHAGVLAALHDELFAPLGTSADDADLIVGTSAGSVVAAYLRAGWPVPELYQLALGTHPATEHLGGDATARRRAMAFGAFATTPLDLARRVAGASFIAVRSVVGAPMPPLPRFVTRNFRAGLFSMSANRERFADDVGTAWPARPLAICAYDVYGRHRAVFSATSTAPATLPEAVTASCAVPGLYSPVAIERRLYVDGGVHSATNLDLAARAEGDLVLVVAPMDLDPEHDVDPLVRLARRLPQRQLADELAVARRRGARVLVIRPTAAEVRSHGVNLMRPSGAARVAEAARSAVLASGVIEELRDALTAPSGRASMARAQERGRKPATTFGQ